MEIYSPEIYLQKRQFLPVPVLNAPESGEEVVEHGVTANRICVSHYSVSASIPETGWAALFDYCTLLYYTIHVLVLYYCIE